MIKSSLAASILLVLILAATLSGASAKSLVGVKKGDWIEYGVTLFGTPPKDHDAKWGRMEVNNVEGNTINLNVTTQFTNGSYLYENITLNLETGQLGDDFFIPANLNLGNSFFDAYSGNVTIDRVEDETYVEAKRKVVFGDTAQTSFSWDRSTGILLEAYSSYTDLNFTMHTVASKTNIWQPDILGLNPNTVYTVSASIIIIGGITATAAAILVKKKNSQRKQPK